ncbi:MAG: hypothetical protein COA78_32925 [Blastopirellula sp.]|nr:MAG: hypothetical protein COA78_32925 [Blastopirellula sp.]
MNIKTIHLNSFHSVSFGVLCLLVSCCMSSLIFAEEDSEISIVEEPITDYDRQHWSFSPLVRPEVPEVKDAEWGKTSIDAFILAKLEAKGLTPAAQANRTTLVRRLHFDLVGIPPSIKTIDKFVNDTRPDAYERLVDYLLNSPLYGERWGQHWLDLARFAETDGYEHDHVRPNAWKYRDWVIKALNNDMPYDEFVRLQLAGDVIAPNDKDAITATAFGLSGADMPDINSQDERKHVLLNEMTSTIGSVFMGLQLGCAQCHDHKYDTISIGDFYRTRAFFDSAVTVTRNKSVAILKTEESPISKSHVMIRGSWERPGPEIESGYLRVVNAGQTQPKSEDANIRRFEFANWLTRPDHPLTARVMVNRIWQHHFGSGLSDTPSDFGVMGELPSHLDLLDWLATEFVSGNWKMKSLHKKIVMSAVYMQDSKADSERSNLDAWKKSLQEDPDARLLSRFPRQRLEAEVIRDAMLAVSGTLSYKRGGKGVMPPLPKELTSTLLKNQWKTSSDIEDHNRRSIYIFARRNMRYPLFDAFDRPDANASCSRRNSSTTAPQALLMMNSINSLKTAQALAGLIWRQSPDDTHLQIQLVFRQALGRYPSEEESARANKFLADQTEWLKAEARDTNQLALPLNDGDIEDHYKATALTDLCLGILNANEFIYID